MSDRSRWFVPTEWLAGRLDDPDIVVIGTSGWAPEGYEYEEGWRFARHDSYA